MSKDAKSRPSRLIPQSPAPREPRGTKRAAKQGPPVAGRARNSYRRGVHREPKKSWWGRGRNSYRRRPQRERKKGWRGAVCAALGLLGVVGLSLGLVVLYHQLLTSPMFCIKDSSHIAIEGTRRLAPAMILQLARLGPGTSLLAVRPGQVERVLLSHPWIARAELTRKWPHRLHLRIQEREPLALVQVKEELYYVDRQGRLFKPLSPGDPHNFPVITGLTAEHFLHEEGAMPEAVDQAFQLLEVLKESAAPLHLEHISEIHVDLERGCSIYVNGLAGALDLGFKDYSEKLKKFAQVWPILAQKGYAARVGRIKLDYPQRVLISLKGMEEN